MSAGKKAKPKKKIDRYPWPRKHIKLLGTMPDSALAEKLGLTVGTILKRRQKYGIAASRPAKTIDWTPELLASLGKVPDRRDSVTTKVIN